MLWLVLLVGAEAGLGARFVGDPAFVGAHGGAADPRWHECGYGIRTCGSTNWCISASFMLCANPGGGGPRSPPQRHDRRRADAESCSPDDRRWAWAVNLFGLTSVPALVRRIVRLRGRLDVDVAGYVPLHRRAVGGGYLVVIVGVLAACVDGGSRAAAVHGGADVLRGVADGLLRDDPHAALRDVLDHRWNTRTVYMNPVSVSCT